MQLGYFAVRALGSLARARVVILVAYEFDKCNKWVTVVKKYELASSEKHNFIESAIFIL